MRSTPLILDDADTKNTTLHDLYDIKVRPSPRTYRLALNICAESMDSSEEKEEIVACALSVIRRMEQRGMLPQEDDAVIESLERCIDALTEESATRQEAKAFLSQATGTPVDLSSNTIAVDQ